MNPARALALFGMVATTFVGGILFQKYGIPLISTTTYFKLEEPLLLEAEGEMKNFHMLPAGTALYKDQSFAEGHTRYLVYLNIKGDVATEKIESDKPNLIDPIWAYPVQCDDLPDLISETPIGKDDLVRILKTRKMTREDLAQIVRDWQE